jgi:hypothetical protein
MKTTKDIVSSAVAHAANAAIVGDGLGGDKHDIFWDELTARLVAAKAKELEG